MKSLHRNLEVTALAAGVALLAACAEQPDTDDELEMPEAVEQPMSADSDMDPLAEAEGSVVMTASFEPGEGAPEGEVNGTVTVLEGAEPGGDYQLAVRVDGLSPGEHAWHIHSAPCGQEGPVVVPFTPTEEDRGLAQPLTPGAGGTVDVNVTVPRDRLTLAQLGSGAYSLHVHQKGGVEHGPTLACANL
jgi:Cu/Zn superoxide dismutase